jgi:hypothetical protein
MVTSRNVSSLIVSHQFVADVAECGRSPLAADLKDDAKSPGFWRTVVASSVLAAVITSVFGLSQVQIARADARETLRRENLVGVQEGLIELVNAQRDIYLIALDDYVKTRDWKTHLDIEAEQKRAHADTKLAAHIVRVGDDGLSKDIGSVRQKVFEISNATTRKDAEKIALSLQRHTDRAHKRIGEMLPRRYPDWVRRAFPWVNE